MKENKVAPFVGELVWMDKVKSGKSKAGKDWTAIDFVLKYTDAQENERHAMFNAFGNELVNTVYAAGIGATIHVDWKPAAREYNGKWFGKNEAYGITEIVGAKKQEQPEDMPDDQQFDF